MAIPAGFEPATHGVETIGWRRKFHRPAKVLRRLDADTPGVFPGIRTFCVYLLKAPVLVGYKGLLKVS